MSADLKEQGNACFKAGKYKEAIELYTRAIECEPDNPVYYGNRSLSYINLHDYQAAANDLLKSINLAPNVEKNVVRLGKVYTLLGNPDAALRTFNTLDSPDRFPEYHNAQEMARQVQMATMALNSGSGLSMGIHALEVAQRYLGMGVGMPRNWQLTKIAALIKTYRTDEATSYVVSLLRQNSQDADALAFRGLILYQEGDNTKAVAFLQQALRCDPDNQSAKSCLRLAKEMEKARNEGNAAFKSGNLLEAKRLYTEALGIDPKSKITNSKLYSNRATVNLKLNLLQEGLSDCDSSLKLDSRFVKVRKTRARILGLMEKWEEAVQEIKDTIEIDGADQTLRAELQTAELELRKSKRKDHYKILGLSKNCSESELKKAYKRKALEFHPDKNANNPDAAEKFKDVNEAYETLSDPQKRAHYDSGADLQDPSAMFNGMGGMGGMGGMPGMGRMGGMGGAHGIDPEVLFQMFGGSGGGFRFA